MLTTFAKQLTKNHKCPLFTVYLLKNFVTKKMFRSKNTYRIFRPFKQFRANLKVQMSFFLTEEENAAFYEGNKPTSFTRINNDLLKKKMKCDNPLSRVFFFSKRSVTPQNQKRVYNWTVEMHNHNKYAVLCLLWAEVVHFGSHPPLLPLSPGFLKLLVRRRCRRISRHYRAALGHLPCKRTLLHATSKKKKKTGNSQFSFLPLDGASHQRRYAKRGE